MRRRRLAVLAAVVVLPLVALACSSDQALTSWIDQADAICRSAQEQADASPGARVAVPG